MTKLDQKPVIHGRDHLAGGADPIPGFITGGGGVVYSDYVQSFSSLIGYWRLGETGSPWADSTSFGNDLIIHTHGAAMTPDVTGGLPAGQDDGAVLLNYAGSAANGGDWLASGPPTPSSFFQLGAMTVAAFVKVHAYPSGSSRGQVAGSEDWAVAGGGFYSGWSLQMQTSGKIAFTRGQTSSGSTEARALSPAALVLDAWYHVAGTYDYATGAIALYLNGTLVDTFAGTAGLARGSTDGVTVGHLDDNSRHLYYAGSLDELAVWNATLSPAEIATLYSAGVDPPDPGDGDQVLVSDGAGGSHWGQANGDAIADGSIVNRHVATGANLDPLKLAHPGGTSSFLRADGTWATPASGSVSTDTLWDAKGDLAAATAADTATRLPVGTNGQVLSADSSTSTGLKWVAAPASDPATATQAWMPLVDSDGLCVLDSGDTLIPTLITL